MRPNVNEVRDTIKNNAVSLALCEILAGRERTRHNTTVQRAMRVLKLRGVIVTKEQVVKSFEQLSTLKLGHVTLSRGRVSAIEWDYDPRMVGKVGLGLASDFREPRPTRRVLMHKVAVEKKPDMSGSIIVKNGQVTVEIPANTDIDRMQSIINSIRRGG